MYVALYTFIEFLHKTNFVRKMIFFSSLSDWAVFPQSINNRLLIDGGNDLSVNNYLYIQIHI